MAKKRTAKVKWPIRAWAYMRLGEVVDLAFYKSQLIMRRGRPLKWLEEDVVRVEIRPAKGAKRK